MRVRRLCSLSRLPAAGRLLNGRLAQTADSFRPTAFCLLLSCICSLPTAFFAQAPDVKPVTGAPAQGNGTPSQPGSTDQSIRVRVQVVSVPVSVLDKRGLPVIDLSQNDFRVYENGKLQTIKYFVREPLPPLRIGLILDTSNSARPQLPFEKDAASEFVFDMLQVRASKNLIFLQTYDAVSSIVQDFTDDPELLNDKIRALKAGGGKALYDAIYYACKEKMLNSGPPEQFRRVLVVVSDGIDVQSHHSLEEATSMARRAETVIYSIANPRYGFTNPGDEVLEDLSQRTGGAAFFPLREGVGADLETGYLSHGQIGDTSQNKGLGAETGKFSAEKLVRLAEALESIGRELNDQYSLGYTPTNDAVDGTYRAIRVEVARKGVQVRTKAGYFATAEQP
jgi:Ca-activated chloride channel homolog